jgi:hypothetical protein
VFDWLRCCITREKMPEYAAIRRTPTRGLPPEVAEGEASQAFNAQCEAIKRSLREPPRRPQLESPLFVELLAASQAGVVTMTLPESGSPCLPIFSTPFRTADYIRTLLARGPAVKFLSSSPLDLVVMLRDLKEVGIERFALDRCPRCRIFTAIESASVTTADDAINCWSIWKATELARLDLYLSHARTYARAGKLESARDLTLETVAHVSFEDPRAHLLLGQIAIVLQDRTMLREAKAFLQFFTLNSWERRLDEDIRSSSPDFECTE